MKVLLVFILVLLMLQGCGNEPQGNTVEKSVTSVKRSEMGFQAIDTVGPSNLSKLGEVLFHETKLSGDNNISCASCHDLSKNGADNKAFSFGVKGKVGEINAPTVFNAVYNFRQFWDGRAASLEEQALGPITNPIEMGSEWPDVIEKLNNDDVLRKWFAKCFDDGVTKENVTKALAEFERTLITPSRFDRYLKGDTSVFSTSEKSGFELFKGYGCVSCHQGVNVGGNMFQRMGIMNDFFEGKEELTAADLGRYNVTNNPSDKFYFKVPSLRNVAITGPYFHDGSAATLEEAVQVMLNVQVGRVAEKDELEDLVAFLGTLTGDDLNGAK